MCASRRRICEQFSLYSTSSYESVTIRCCSCFTTSSCVGGGRAEAAAVAFVLAAE